MKYDNKKNPQNKNKHWQKLTVFSFPCKTFQSNENQIATQLSLFQWFIYLGRLAEKLKGNSRPTFM